jgi:hypothetical protein
VLSLNEQLGVSHVINTVQNMWLEFNPTVRAELVTGMLRLECEVHMRLTLEMLMKLYNTIIDKGAHLEWKPIRSTDQLLLTFGKEHITLCVNIFRENEVRTTEFRTVRPNDGKDAIISASSRLERRARTGKTIVSSITTYSTNRLSRKMPVPPASSPLFK